MLIIIYIVFLLFSLLAIVVYNNYTLSFILLIASFVYWFNLSKETDISKLIKIKKTYTNKH